jgi:hypothetical protein
MDNFRRQYWMNAVTSARRTPTGVAQLTQAVIDT